MKIKNNYTKINEVGDYLIDESANIILIESNIREIIKAISSNWIGLDFDMFATKGETYLKQIDMIQDKINKSGGFLNESVEDYKKVESKYSNLVGEV